MPESATEQRSAEEKQEEAEEDKSETVSELLPPLLLLLFVLFLLSFFSILCPLRESKSRKEVDQSPFSWCMVAVDTKDARLHGFPQHSLLFACIHKLPVIFFTPSRLPLTTSESAAGLLSAFTSPLPSSSLSFLPCRNSVSRVEPARNNA